jgi:hypothetical protein
MHAPHKRAFCQKGVAPTIYSQNEIVFLTRIDLLSDAFHSH